MPRTFYSGSVESALHAARAALGDDSMLVEAGTSPPRDSSLGPFRVVAIGPDESRSKAGGVETAAPQITTDGALLDKVRGELRSMRESLDAVGVLAARTLLERSVLAQTAELSPWIRRLLEADVPAVLVHSIADSAARRLRLEAPGCAVVSPAEVRRAVHAELDSRLEVSPGFGKEDCRCKAVALAGPAGAGKTTTLAKLAMRHAVGGRRQGMILSLDVFRIGAAEQLRSLAAILGIPFRLCETPGSLRRALDDAKERDMVFIDTPGAGPGELEWWQAWVPRVIAEPEIEIQLVLPATTSTGQLAAWIRRYRRLRPRRLMFTHLDEAATFGGILAACQEARLPISYLANGQGIPEDVESATKARLLELLVGETGVFSTAA